MQSAVVKRQEGRRQPMYSHSVAEKVLAAEEQEWCADVLDHKIDQVNVECMEALCIIRLLVVQLVEVVVLLRVKESVQRPEEDGVSQHQQRKERDEDFPPAFERQRQLREVDDAGFVHHTKRCHAKEGRLEDVPVRLPLNWRAFAVWNLVSHYVEVKLLPAMQREDRQYPQRCASNR